MRHVIIAGFALLPFLLASTVQAGDKPNRNGHYMMDMGGGDKMDLENGDYIMDMGGDDNDGEDN
jgi:hypothetical protein